MLSCEQRNAGLLSMSPDGAKAQENYLRSRLSIPLNGTRGEETWDLIALGSEPDCIEAY